MSTHCGYCFGQGHSERNCDSAPLPDQLEYLADDLDEQRWNAGADLVRLAAKELKRLGVGKVRKVRW